MLIICITDKCSEGWVGWDNSCYKHNPDQLVDLKSGLDYCYSEEASLFVPNSRDEAMFMAGYLDGKMKANSLQGLVNDYGLVGAKLTGLTRYLEYVDGTAMYQGYFYDNLQRTMGNVCNGNKTGQCFIIDNSGSIKECPNGKSSIICEKKIDDMDSICLDKPKVSSLVTLDSNLDITMEVSVVVF